MCGCGKKNQVLYTPARSNYNNYFGEIDIVARRFRTTAFVEVKTRGTSADLDYAVDRHRLRRVAAAASALAARHAFPKGDIRIDVILITPGRLPRHLSNVWDG